MKEQKRLELELQKAESEHKRNGCNANGHKVIRTRTALNTLLSQNAEKGLFRQKHKIYEYANRSGRYLANLISNTPSNKSINKIKDKHGKLHYTNIEIANVFNEFFSSLYTSKTVGMDDKINDFFQCIKLPKVSDDDLKIGLSVKWLYLVWKLRR